MTDKTDLTRRETFAAAAALAVGGIATTASAQTATDDDRKAVAESYLKSLDAGGVSPQPALVSSTISPTMPRSSSRNGASPRARTR